SRKAARAAGPAEPGGLEPGGLEPGGPGSADRGPGGGGTGSGGTGCPGPESPGLGSESGPGTDHTERARSQPAAAAQCLQRRLLVQPGRQEPGAERVPGPGV